MSVRSIRSVVITGVVAFLVAVTGLVTATPASALADGYYQPGYSDAIYHVSGGAASQVTYQQWADAGFPSPQPAPTDYVKYPWSPTIYAVTFWYPAQSSWLWHQLAYPEWQKAGYPSPRNAGYIAGSYFYKWGTAGELFVMGTDGVHHKLTYQEWSDSGFRTFDDRSNEGFAKLSWAPQIARMPNLVAGYGYPIGYDEWRNEALPTPRTYQRFTGDQFNQSYGDPAIYYSGPTMSRAITFSEWQAAGSPRPYRANPGDTKDCTDFATHAAAQDWFNFYYPDYGDVARLDQDNDGIACESLR